MRDRGSAALEAAIVTPGLLLIGMLMYAAVLTMSARGEVQGAARAAARAASVADSVSDANARARQAVSAAVSADSSCRDNPAVSVSGFAGGGVVTVSVSCSSNPIFGNVVGPRTYTATASESVSEIRGGLE